MQRAQKIPGPEHPITIEPSSRRVRVVVAGESIAETISALVLKEAAYPEVFYVPRADVDESKLVRSETESYCPYKGDCSYFSVKTDDGVVDDAAWSYEEPFEAVAQISGHLAFYPNRVDLQLDPSD